MNNVIESLALPTLGAAQATVFGVFLVAAVGKLAGCRPGLMPMCVKGGVDAALALLACLVLIPGAPQAAAVAAIAVGAGGWLRERISRNSVCNCFGVLTHVFHPWRNAARAILVGSGLLVLALASQIEPAASALWMGAALGLSTLLAVAALALGRSPLLRRMLPVHIEPVATLAEGRISPETAVGTDVNGRLVRLQDLAVPGTPLALLLTSPHCAKCEVLKAELEPLLPGAPIEVHQVVEGAPDGPARPAGLLDPQGQLRRHLGIKMLPSLVLIDGHGTNLARPIAMGSEAIKGELLRLLLQPHSTVSDTPAMAQAL